ncbi:MAG: hypothetical protein ACRD07_09145 [Acidimicrobiales bacterium]
MLVLGVVLLLYAIVVAHADSRYERERLDDLLGGRVASASDAVRVGADGTVTIEPAAEAGLTRGYPRYMSSSP